MRYILDLPSPTQDASAANKGFRKDSGGRNPWNQILAYYEEKASQAASISSMAELKYVYCFDYPACFPRSLKHQPIKKHTFARLTVHEYLEDHPRTRQVVSNPAFKSYLGHLQGVLGTYITMGQLPTYRSWGLILQVFHHFMRKKNKP